MDYQYQKPTSVRLRDVGKDEKWLQEQVEKDPSILGLGDLSIIERERKQSSGGRIDFLMYNPEDGIRYEIELMLGKVDEEKVLLEIGSPPDFQFSVARTSQSPFPLAVI